jgi:hypothetical protein
MLTTMVPTPRVASRSRGDSGRGGELFDRRVPLSVIELVDAGNTLEMTSGPFGQMRKVTREWRRFVHFNSWCSYRCTRSTHSPSSLP